MTDRDIARELTRLGQEMSDVDRLRQAADRADTLQIVPQIGALLRAVANVHDLQDGEPDTPCDCEELIAALALADVIMGTDNG